MIHDLKILTEHLEDIAAGRKTFEVRHTGDRTFAAGDELRLHEWDPRALTYLGRGLRATVSMVHSGYGMDDGYVCMALGAVEKLGDWPEDLARAGLAALGAVIDPDQSDEPSRSPRMYFFSTPHSAKQWAEKHILPKAGAPSSSGDAEIPDPLRSATCRPWWYAELERAVVANRDLQDRTEKAEARWRELSIQVAEMEADKSKLQDEADGWAMRAPRQDQIVVDRQEWEELNEFFEAYDTMQETGDFKRRHLAWSKIHDRRTVDPELKAGQA